MSSSTTSRPIDRITTTRTTEMEVLCLGLSRTATMSLQTALNTLGYRTYHYTEIFKNRQDPQVEYWTEALKAKIYGNGRRYGRVEFDRLLWSYSAVTDALCANLAQDLIAAYPNAKVVLSTRDVDAWLQSMETSYYAILNWKIPRYFPFLETEGIKKHAVLLRLILSDWTSEAPESRAKLREGYFKHCEHVRSLISKKNLLEHRPRDGWGPLCKFLGKPVPENPYPRVNEGNNAAEIYKKGFWYLAVRKILTWLVPVGIALVIAI